MATLPSFQPQMQNPQQRQANRSLDPSLSNKPSVNSDKSHSRRYPKREEEAYHNITHAMTKAPIEYFATLTITFPKNLEAKEASRTMGNFKRRILPKIFPCDYVQIIEPGANGRLHFHTLGNCGRDILTGFNVVRYLSDRKINSKLRGKARRAALRRSRNKFGPLTKNAHHKTLLKRLKEVVANYGIGRTQLIPVYTSASVTAEYLTKFLAKPISGAYRIRRVAYSRDWPRCVDRKRRFTTLNKSSKVYRRKLEAFCKQVGFFTLDDAERFFRRQYGANWQYIFRTTICSMPLPEESDAAANHSGQSRGLIDEAMVKLPGSSVGRFSLSTASGKLPCGRDQEMDFPRS